LTDQISGKSEDGAEVRLTYLNVMDFANGKLNRERVFEGLAVFTAKLRRHYIEMIVGSRGRQSRYALFDGIRSTQWSAFPNPITFVESNRIETSGSMMPSTLSDVTTDPGRQST
jgi:hypothetical protein